MSDLLHSTESILSVTSDSSCSKSEMPLYLRESWQLQMTPRKVLILGTPGKHITESISTFESLTNQHFCLFCHCVCMHVCKLVHAYLCMLDEGAHTAWHVYRSQRETLGFVLYLF